MIRSQMPHLFNRVRITDYLRARTEGISEAVGAINRDQFLNTSIDTLVEHLTATLVIEPITLDLAGMFMDQEETPVNANRYPMRAAPFYSGGPAWIPGIRLKISIPFTGSPDLFDLTPTTYQTVSPRGHIQTQIGRPRHLEIEFERPADDTSDIKTEVDRELESLKFFVESQRRDIDGWNAALSTRVREAALARRERLVKSDAVVESIGIPLRRRQEAPDIESLQMRRKLVRPLPSPPRTGFAPEPGITDQDYEHILAVIRHEGRTQEQVPGTFASLDEESLRDLLLAHLNGHYEGDASGETFRREGKTDIRIEAKDRAAFVAELKIWRGSSELSAACDQLLGYLTWRDCKAAIVIYNKHNARFSELLEKAPAAIRSHPLFLREKAQRHPAEWRFTLSSREDASREVTIHLFMFDILPPRSPGGSSVLERGDQ